MSKRVFWIIMVVATLNVAALMSQAPSGPQKPGPEHKRLAYFVGKWTGEGELKPSPFGPGGMMTSKDDCEWFAGGYHVVCRSEGKGPMGDLKALALIGYNAEDKIYTYYGVDNMGMGELSRGTVAGKAWTWNGESKMGGKVLKSRYTVTEVSPTSYTFKWETSADGGPYALVMEGKATKVGTTS